MAHRNREKEKKNELRRGYAKRHQNTEKKTNKFDNGGNSDSDY